MTTSIEHERIKKWLGGLLDIYFDEAALEIFPCGQATMRLSLKQAGAEPDDSWCLGAEQQFPYPVLEIALTSGGIPKLDIYRKFGTPEAWLWRKSRLDIFAFSPDGAYNQVSTSKLVPALDVSLLERCVTTRSWTEARRAFRDGIARE